MIQQIVAVRDSAMKAFTAPQAVPTLQVAIRSFIRELNRADPNNLLYTNAEDYELYHLGTFNDETGQFDNADPVSIARAKDHRNQPEKAK